MKIKNFYLDPDHEAEDMYAMSAYTDSALFAARTFLSPTSTNDKDYPSGGVLDTYLSDGYKPEKNS